MKHLRLCPAVSACAMALALFAGCRREDVRACVVSLPDLTEADKPKVEAAFRTKTGMVYDGIQMENLAYDYVGKTLTVTYDSMKIAQTNIRMLLEAKGFRVVYPTNTTGVAGYVP